MKENAFSERMPYAIYYIMRNMILICGICILAGIVITLWFYVKEESAFIQTFIGVLGYLGLLLMIIGGLIVVGSAGLAAPGTPVSHARAQELKEWRRGSGSRLAQGGSAFLSGILLFIIAVVFA